MIIRTYSELCLIKTFEERFRYLQLNGVATEETFGSNRWINQEFYKDRRWLKVRDEVIIRDEGCDLGISDRIIPPGVTLIVHHINPIREVDILERRPIVFDKENLITTTLSTHNAIHYGDMNLIMPSSIVERSPNDTSPWRK